MARDFLTAHATSERTHAGPKDADREAELRRPSGVVCSDFFGSAIILTSMHNEKNGCHCPRVPAREVGHQTR
jgi:hypothetical protein